MPAVTRMHAVVMMAVSAAAAAAAARCRFLAAAVCCGAAAQVQISSSYGSPASQFVPFKHPSPAQSLAFGV